MSRVGPIVAEDDDAMCSAFPHALYVVLDLERGLQQAEVENQDDDSRDTRVQPREKSHGEGGPTLYLDRLHLSHQRSDTATL